jgi:hypothetical protein
VSSVGKLPVFLLGQTPKLHRNSKIHIHTPYPALHIHAHSTPSLTVVSITWIPSLGFHHLDSTHHSTHQVLRS